MVDRPFADGRAGIDAELVVRLIATQFPQWRDLPVRPVARDGWDNRTYRLGTDMSVRLPTSPGYVPAVSKEQQWLPVLAPSVPVPVPRVLGNGQPGHGYPFPWSVRSWLPGARPERSDADDLLALAKDVAGFLTSLQKVDPAGGPVAGAHSAFRGADLTHYDTETRRALDALTGHIDTAAAHRLWDQALAAAWSGPPVWFHGDVAAGNLLVAEGRLVGVIDFGTCGVGDPSCDLVIAWTLFSSASRAAFREAVDADAAMWARARGWALWKAAITVVTDQRTTPSDAAENLRLITGLVAES